MKCQSHSGYTRFRSSSNLPQFMVSFRQCDVVIPPQQTPLILPWMLGNKCSTVVPTAHPPTSALLRPVTTASIFPNRGPARPLNTSGQSRQAGHLTVFVGLGISWRNEGLRWCLRDYWVSWVTCVLEFRVNGIRYWFLKPLSRQCRPVLTCCTDTRETLEPSTSPWTINRVHILLRTLFLWPYSYVTGLYFDTSADITVIYQ